MFSWFRKADNPRPERYWLLDEARGEVFVVTVIGRDGLYRRVRDENGREGALDFITMGVWFDDEPFKRDIREMRKN